MKELSPYQLGYVAALIDGEGTIGLGRSKPKGKKECNYAPFVNVDNTNPTLILWCQSTTGIGYFDRVRRRQDNWKPSHVWRLRVDEIPVFLHLIEPYLLIKRLQAQLLMEYFEKCRGACGSSPSESVQILRSVIYDELAELNKRGI